MNKFTLLTMSIAFSAACSADILSSPNQVKVTNKSSKAITSALLSYNSSLPAVPDTPMVVGEFKAIGKQKSSKEVEVQVGKLGDYWGLIVQFEDDDTHYVLTGVTTVTPYKECRTPGDGSTEFIVSDNLAVKIRTYNGSDFSDSDGDCQGSLSTLGTLGVKWGAILSKLL
ncbi:hypothetical protein L1285_16020 [Pseudoalteromonas sp. DL2-H2.2]|uniref:hypothetical protein n=1 Tax=Pseudoalteromonas sp. DL2-H2.2 TaxID=2908889 RepID=UPI001F1EAFA4|nr:hypothetical protein [Pseudoalteromonas sp. DL2-H2.2]MCF2909833.1 hypothetical protein [Pseudoalteromonas sp. DL2-H2.2]